MNLFRLKDLPRDSAYTVAALLLVPNALFFLVNQVWFIDRAVINIDYLLIGLLLVPFGAAVAGLGVVIIALIDLVFSIAPAYHFSLGSTLDSLSELFALSPGFLLIELSKALFLITVCTGSVMWFMRRAGRNFNVVVTCILAGMAVFIADLKLSANAMAKGDTYSINTNIAASSLNNLRVAVSTAGQSGATQRASAARSAADRLRDEIAAGRPGFRNNVLIVVESLGKFEDPGLNRFQLEPLLELSGQDQVSVQAGDTRAVGSTVPGELRELCGIRLLVVHPRPERLPSADCLPEAFNSAGYATLGIHGFHGTLFSRNRWYPALDFDEIWFAPEISRRLPGAGRCGLAFNGICDEEIWSLIEAELVKQADAPRFIYWLTLSAHLPIEKPPEQEKSACQNQGLLSRSPGICHLALRHRRLFDRIAQGIRSHQLRDTRILVVGDHPPPFVERTHREFFKEERVPFVEIKIQGPMDKSDSGVRL